MSQSIGKNGLFPLFLIMNIIVKKTFNSNEDFLYLIEQCVNK